MRKRTSGILLHITSLPSRYGIGDFGPEAYRFADFLVKAKQSYWQILPLCPPVPAGSHSPYNCISAFAGNTLLISPELLYRKGLLSKKDVQNKPVFPKGCVDYKPAAAYKTRLLNIALERFKTSERAYEKFCLENKNWLDDFAIFAALRKRFRYRLWFNWPKELRDRNKYAIKSIKTQLHNAIEREKFLQYLFFEQWFHLKRYCNHHNIRIIGDIPIYVAYDSADVWTQPEIFKLTSTKKPRFVSGVPPDLFSRTGQLWGNPVYNWKVLKDTNYQWWLQRVKHNLRLFDIVRIDHFRGFVSYWEVAAGQKTAAKGKWIKGPGEDFFNKLFEQIPSSAIIVEDLGYITPKIRQLIRKLRLACMKVLLFAFDGEAAKNPHWLGNHIRNCVVYTGTHDTNTAKGWFEKQAGPEQKKKLFDCVGRKVTAGDVPRELMKLAMSSASNLAIIPMQDILGLGQEGRMNLPATTKGNWSWQLKNGQIKPQIANKLAKLTQVYERE